MQAIPIRNGLNQWAATLMLASPQKPDSRSKGMRRDNNVSIGAHRTDDVPFQFPARGRNPKVEAAIWQYPAYDRMVVGLMAPRALNSVPVRCDRCGFCVGFSVSSKVSRSRIADLGN